MKNQILTAILLATTLTGFAQWKPAGTRIKTEWAEKVNPANVLPEYPRPLLERAEWANLNGEWEYAILPKDQSEPAKFDGKILVPFAVESSLSGVAKTVGETNYLWYKRTFSVPKSWKNKDLILNFGAVDWQADVYLNDVLIGSHKGGYSPFQFNITPYLKGNGNQKLVVRVWDPSDKGFQPRGKQVSNPARIFYTAVTGIWQTVWLEPVAGNYVTAVKSISNIDNNTVDITVSTSNDKISDIVEVKIIDKGKTIATAKGIQGKPLQLSIKDPILWSTTNPYLYDIKISLWTGNKKIDEVSSYMAMRKISSKRDKDGIMRFQLNNKDIFQYGPLDQGWWPDGLYTAPTDEALLFDIKKTKNLGFNMIRKHVKVEPARWYYHCDKEGMLVWQDMPGGEGGNKWEKFAFNVGTDVIRTPESASNFYREWKEIMDLLISNPSVVMWVPFNESWGQFDTEKIAAWTKNYDPSRLVNSASGGNHRFCGDVLDLHHYPNPSMLLFDNNRVNVLGEYGGIGLALTGHLWAENKNFGYVMCKNTDEVTAQYVKYAEDLKKYVGIGMCAAVYTQTTDVEEEINGLITYDRKVMKINEAEVKKVNQEVIDLLK
jgi:beta-galactosidase/beta-glucuronidase